MRLGTWLPQKTVRRQQCGSSLGRCSLVDMKDYGPLLDLEDAPYLFTGQRGSKYAVHSDASTTGYRTPSNKPKGTPPSLQGKSAKTLFFEPQAAATLGPFINDEYLGTRLEPVFDANNTLKAVKVVATDFAGAWSKQGRKPGEVLSVIPATTTPQKGLLPIEFGTLESPVGTRSVDAGRMHLASPITSVDRTPSSVGKVGGKVGIAAALMSALGAAKAGEYGKAAGIVGESMLPLGVTPTELAPGTLSPELKAEQDAYNAQRQAEKKAQVAKQQALLRSGVTLPEEYRRGGRVRMI
jgi:hypothetical protein